MPRESNKEVESDSDGGMAVCGPNTSTKWEANRSTSATAGYNTVSGYNNLQANIINLLASEDLLAG